MIKMTRCADLNEGNACAGVGAAFNAVFANLLSGGERTGLSECPARGRTFRDRNGGGAAFLRFELSGFSYGGARLTIIPKLTCQLSRPSRLILSVRPLRLMPSRRAAADLLPRARARASRIDFRSSSSMRS